MKKLFKWLKMIFCRHNWESVKDSPWYFHWKCHKCNAERGMGKFKIK